MEIQSQLHQIKNTQGQKDNKMQPYLGDHQGY